MALTLLRNGSGEVLANSSGVAFVVNLPSVFTRRAASAPAAGLRTLGSGSSSTYAFGGAVLAGSLLVLDIANYPSGIASVTDSLGNTWQRAVTFGDESENFAEIWWCASSVAGTPTLTITPTSTTDNYLSGYLTEYTVTGGGTVVLDRTGTVSSTGTTTTVLTSAATVAADELAHTVAVIDASTTNAFFSLPADWRSVDVEQDSSTTTGYQAGEQFTPAAGTISVVHTHPGVTVGVDAVIATWRVSSGAAGITGSASITVGAITGSGAAAVRIAGVAAITVGAITSQGAAGIRVQGSAAITIGEVTAAGTAGTSVRGAGAVLVGEVTASGAAAVLVRGSASIEVGPILAEGSAGSAAAGAADIMVGPVVASGAGAVRVSGAGVVTVGAVTLDAAAVIGEPPRMGSADILVGPVTCSGAAAVLVRGAGDITVGPILSAGAAGARVSGSAAITIGPVTVVATASRPVLAVADITIGPVTLVATGVQGEVIQPESEFLRYVVPARGLRYAAPASALGYAVPRPGLLYAVPPRRDNLDTLEP